MKVIGSRIEIPNTDENVIRVNELYGKTHKIQAVKGVNVDLRNLSSGESVCYGDGKTYHFLLTKK